MLSTEGRELPKTVRRRSPKVKTGCITCKARRVKCDEKRPSCFRCTSTGRTCDGYVKPKQGYQVQVFSQTPVSRFQTPITTLSGLGENVQYLEFYHYCAGRTLSNKSDNEFWTQIPLQMAQSEPAVRHALIALGYLSRQETGSLKHARLGYADGYKRNTLLLHYNKSVRSLVNRMAEPSYLPEIGLVTCLLYVCIEFLRADHRIAFTHMRNGLRIISEFRRTRQTDPSIQLNEAILSRDSSASNDMIENKLAPMFTQVMATALLYGEHLEDDYHIQLPLPHSFPSGGFTSIREAEHYQHELRNAATVFTRRIVPSVIQLIPPTPSELIQQTQIIDSHHAWYQSLLTFESSQSLTPEDKIRISTLKMSHYMSAIMQSCITQIDQMAYDAHIADFKSILHHATLVLASMNLLTTTGLKSAKTSPAANFTFNSSLIPPVYFTAVYCRCPETRRQALALLALNPPREGLWDAEQHLVVASRAMQIEELDVDERGWPRRRARLWSAVIDVDMDRDGRFRVDFLPARWVGQGIGEDAEGDEADGAAEGCFGQKVITEWFVLGDGLAGRKGEVRELQLLPSRAVLH